MDENSRRRRLNDLSYSGPDARFNPDSEARGFAGTSAGRHRPASLNTSPPAARGGATGVTNFSGYYQVASPSFPNTIQSTNLQYPATSGYATDQRQQPQSGFAAYNPDVMYNVSQQTTPSSSVYNPSSQFQTRQPTGMQLLSDVAAPYFPNETTSGSEASNLQHHPSSTAAPTVFSQNSQQQQQQQPPPPPPPPPTQSSSDRNSILQPTPEDRVSIISQNYTSIPMGNMAQASEVMEEEFTSQGPGMEAAYTTYQNALKEIFQNIIHGRLREASQSLVETSEWLLSHVGELGLTVDEVSLHEDRIRLWGEFNTAWLGIFQKQKDMLESGMRLPPNQSLMSQETINKMARHLIKMCDLVEKHGLVDYQYGVAEEQIMAILMECLDLQETLEKMEGDDAGPSVGIGRAPS